MGENWEGVSLFRGVRVCCSVLGEATGRDDPSLWPIYLSYLSRDDDPPMPAS